MKKTLLQKALITRTKRKRLREYTDEEIELSIACFKGEVSFTQYVEVMLGREKKNYGGSSYSYLFQSIKQGIEDNKIILELKGNEEK